MCAVASGSTLFAFSDLSIYCLAFCFRCFVYTTSLSEIMDSSKFRDEKEKKKTKKKNSFRKPSKCCIICLIGSFIFGIPYALGYSISTHLHVHTAKTQIRVFAGTMLVAEDPKRLQADREDSDQTARIWRPVGVFAGRRCSLVGNAVPRLESFYLDIVLNNPCPAEPGYACLCKQCRSRSVGLSLWRILSYRVSI